MTRRDIMGLGFSHKQTASLSGPPKHETINHTPILRQPKRTLHLPQTPEKKLDAMHILVADDNAVNRLLITTIINKNGGCSEIACNGDEAVEKSLSAKFDAIIMDIHMPKLDGIEAMELIKSVKPELTIIAITADTEQDVLRKRLDAGFDACLVKPIREHALVQMLLRPYRNDPLPSQDTDPGSDDSIYDEVSALRASGGKKDLAEHMLQMFLKDLQGRQDSLINDDLSRAALLDMSHTLHGAAVYCGARRIKTRAAKLENRLIKQAPDEEIQSLKAQLIESIDELLCLKNHCLDLPTD